GDDFLDTSVGCPRQTMAENGNKRNEHQASWLRQFIFKLQYARRMTDPAPCNYRQSSIVMHVRRVKIHRDYPAGSMASSLASKWTSALLIAACRVGALIWAPSRSVT